MMKFKTTNIIQGMNNKELMDYLVVLRSYKDELKQHVTDWADEVKYVKELLQDRKFELEIDLLEAEENRLNCDYSEIDIVTGLH